jgi:non-heme chloroperoxidase
VDDRAQPEDAPRRGGGAAVQPQQPGLAGVLPRITLPTLVVGGQASIFPWRSQAWIHEQIPGSRLEVFAEAESGSHFMFIENPAKFNRLVAEFIG